MGRERLRGRLPQARARPAIPHCADRILNPWSSQCHDPLAICSRSRRPWRLRRRPRGQTLNTVKATRHCSIAVRNGTLAGFGLPDAQGNWTGLDVDFCRALAAAIFNDPTKVKFVPLTAKDRFTALQSGEIDVLSRNTTWTSLARHHARPQLRRRQLLRRPGLHGAQDAQGESALESSDAAVCVQQGTTTELNLADYFRANKMKLQAGHLREARRSVEGLRHRPLRRLHHRRVGPLRRAPEARQRRTTTSCCRRSSPRSRSARSCARATTSGSTSCKWTHFAMLNAEELGVTKANVDEQMKSDNPEIKRLLGTEGKHRRGARPDQGLGLSDHQARRQLRRGLRAQCRPGLAAEDHARPQRAVDQGRPAVRAADPLSASRLGTVRHDGSAMAQRRRTSVVETARPQASLIYDPRFRGIAYPGRCCCVADRRSWSAARSATPSTIWRAPTSRPASASGTTPPASTSARR